MLRKLLARVGSEAERLENRVVERGANLADFWLNIVVLAGMGVGVFSLCALRFKQKVA